MTQDTIDQTRETARQSETGQRMSASQFDEAWQVTGIIHREIQKSGSFIEKLTDYAHAFARNERFDAARGEMVLRDLYKARYGETMNETREALRDQEMQVEENSRDLALDRARAVLTKIQDDKTIPFWKAYDQGGVAFAAENSISETFAKSIMKKVFEETEGQDFYTVGKEVEKNHYRPERAAERDGARDRAQSKRRTAARSGPSR